MRRKTWFICIVLVLVFSAGSVGLFYLKRYLGNCLHRVIRVAVREELDLDSRDIRRQRERKALEETAVFVVEHMPKAPEFVDRFALLDHSLGSVDPRLDGHYCEFGVHTGISINHIAAGLSHTIHGFDSFEGLPETWRTGYEAGAFKMSGLPEVRENVELHEGWFHESLPVWAEANPGPMAFMHVDSDLYSSAKTILDVLRDRIVPGTVIQFDDYFNYSGWQQGEHRAFKEFAESRGAKFEYLGYCRQDDAVSVRILSVESTLSD